MKHKRVLDKKRRYLMEEQKTNQVVLIVDDDATLREMYEAYLKAAGFTVVAAQDGKEGLEKAKANKPAIILLDLMMPEMNGIEVLKHLKADNELKAIPVIVFTALIQDLEKQQSFDAGAADYVVKTELVPSGMLDKIKALIGKPAAPAATSETSAAPTTDTTPAETAAPPSTTT
jgi:CheY-like chemotaxis protein